MSRLAVVSAAFKATWRHYFPMWLWADVLLIWVAIGFLIF